MGKASKAKDKLRGSTIILKERDGCGMGIERLLKDYLVDDCFQTCLVTEAALSHNESQTAL